MERAQKQEHIDFLKGVFSDVESIVLTTVEKLNATEVNDLRSRLRKAGVEFKVVKNKLAKIATQGSQADVLNDDFVGSTGMAWSVKDAVLPAKVLVEFQKECETIQLKAGFNAGRRLDVNAVKALADMPSLEELRARLLGVMQAVSAKLLAQINAPATHVVGVLQAKVDEGQKG